VFGIGVMNVDQVALPTLEAGFEMVVTYEKPRPFGRGFVILATNATFSRSL
jgi:hypothetical protein